MAVIHELNERSREIFRHIVEAYVDTGEPVGSRTLSWTSGWRRREIELRRISGVRLAIRRSKYGNYIEVLVEGPDGPTDVRPKDADPFAVYRAILAGLRDAGSNAPEGQLAEVPSGIGQKPPASL